MDVTLQFMQTTERAQNLVRQLAECNVDALRRVAKELRKATEKDTSDSVLVVRLTAAELIETCAAAQDAIDKMIAEAKESERG